jgi:hypothetical protein
VPLLRRDRHALVGVEPDPIGVVALVHPDHCQRMRDLAVQAANDGGQDANDIANNQG